MKNLTNWRTWLHGLFAAIVGGSSNAVTLIIVDPLKFNMTHDGWKNLGTAVLVSGIVSAALYLKQSPVPPETTTTDIKA